MVAKDLGGHVADQIQIAGKADQRADFVRAEETIRRADLGLAAECVPPRNEVERKLSGIWQEVFGIDIVGVTDDFFELGGDSLNATTLAAEIEATFGRRFTPADIITLSTVAQQAQVVADANALRLPACLILGRAGGAKPPLFMVHGGKGFAFFRPAFLDIVGEDRPIYLFQAPGLDGRTPLDSIDEMTTVEQIASMYVDAIRSIQPNGPFHIAAICAGSFIAIEMCNQLENAGHTIGRLVLLDPTPVPPKIKPSAVKEKEKKQRIKKTSKQRLGARFLDFFTRGHEGGGKTEKSPDPTEMLRKKLDAHREMVEKRVEQMAEVPVQQRSYTAERMLKISLQFRAALYRHVPRRYPGKATMLVSSIRAEETLADTAFWPNHLGSMQYEVLGSDHSDVFNENLEETARFVRDALN
jgi:thioesterase domain-containing protein/acyl carrier protein